MRIMIKNKYPRENTSRVRHMVRGHILITTAPGEMRDIRERIESLSNIKSVEMVTGPYDLIAQAEAEDLSTLTSTVLDNIRHITGVLDTTTCVVIE